jgi:DNA repair exonuclease SbcCD ATPase subunit
MRASQMLLNKSHEHQAEIQDLLAELDTIKSKAEDSVKNINTKYNDAKNINKTLKGTYRNHSTFSHYITFRILEFHHKVQSSRQEAKDALEKKPEIINIINSVTDPGESLAESEANANAAKKKAEKANTKYATQALKVIFYICHRFRSWVLIFFLNRMRLLLGRR